VLVEEVLAELGHSPPPRVQVPGTLHAWKITQGSATATVALLERSDFTHVRISAVVMTLDDNVARGALFAHLLTLNADLCGNAFALEGDRVLLVAERSTLDLDRSEIHDLVRRVTTNADNHDDELVATWGGRMGEL